MPAFAAHPTYLQLRGPTPAPMDTPMYPEYYHMVDGRERQHDEATNTYTRRTVEEFHGLGRVRVTDPQAMPHMAFQPSPTEPDITVQQPGLTLTNIKASRVPESVAAIHHTQQATIRRRMEVRAQQQERSRRRDAQRTPAATTPTAGQPAAGQPAVPNYTTSATLPTERNCT